MEQLESILKDLEEAHARHGIEGVLKFWSSVTKNQMIVRCLRMNCLIPFVFGKTRLLIAPLDEDQEHTEAAVNYWQGQMGLAVWTKLNGLGNSSDLAEDEEHEKVMVRILRMVLRAI